MSPRPYALFHNVLWKVASVIQYAIYLVLRYFIRYRRLIILKNLHNTDLAKSKGGILKKQYEHLAQLAVSSLLSFFIHKDEIRARFRLDRPVDRYITQDNGPVMIWTAHYNNWEWAGLVLATLTKRPVRLVYQKQNSFIQKQINRLRQRTGATLISQEELVKSLVLDKKLDTAALYVMLCDQGPIYIEKSFWINFLGLKTPFLSGPERLARKLKLPVYYSAIYGSLNGYYPSFIPLKTEGRKGELTLQYAHQLERTIRKAPHLWLWTHRRWKRAHRHNEVIDPDLLLFNK